MENNTNQEAKVIETDVALLVNVTKPRKKIISKKVIVILACLLAIVGIFVVVYFAWWYLVPIATVNGEKITRTDFNHTKYHLSKFYEYTNNKDGLKNLAKNARDKLIEDKAIDIEAKKRGISVSEAEVNSKYKGLVSKYNSEEDFKQTIGMAYDWTPEMTKESMRILLLKERLLPLVLKGYDVTEYMVRYDMGEDEAVEDPAAKPAIEDAYKQILAGQTIEQLADNPNCRPSKCLSKSLKLVNQETAKTTFFASKGEDYAAIAKMAVQGDYTGVVKSSGGYYVIYRADKIYGGSSNTWNEFINSYNKDNVTYGPLTKIIANYKDTSNWFMGLIVAIAKAACPEDVYSPSFVWGNAIDSATGLGLQGVLVEEQITDYYGQCKTQFLSDAKDPNQIIDFSNFYKTRTTDGDGYFQFGGQASVECHYHWSWTFSKAEYETVVKDGQGVANGQDEVVQASMWPVRYDLNVNIVGVGSVVTNATDPPGKDAGGNVSTINCSNSGGVCSLNYRTGTPVTLTATPGSGYKIEGILWSGNVGNCASIYTSPCTINMGMNKNITATFVPDGGGSGELPTPVPTSEPGSTPIPEPTSEPGVTPIPEPTGPIVTGIPTNTWELDDHSKATPEVVIAGQQTDVIFEHDIWSKGPYTMTNYFDSTVNWTSSLKRPVTWISGWGNYNQNDPLPSKFLGHPKLARLVGIDPHRINKITVPKTAKVGDKYCQNITYTLKTNNRNTGSSVEACVMVVAPTSEWDLTAQSNVIPSTVTAGQQTPVTFLHDIWNTGPGTMTTSFDSTVSWTSSLKGTVTWISGWGNYNQNDPLPSKFLGHPALAKNIGIDPHRVNTFTVPNTAKAGDRYCQNISYTNKNKAGNSGTSSEACVTVVGAPGNGGNYGVRTSPITDYEKGDQDREPSSKGSIPVKFELKIISRPTCIVNRDKWGQLYTPPIVQQVSLTANGNNNGQYNPETRNYTFTYCLLTPIRVQTVPEKCTTDPLTNKETCTPAKYVTRYKPADDGYTLGAYSWGFSWNLSTNWLDTLSVGSKTYTTTCGGACSASHSSSFIVYEVPYARFYGGDVYATNGKIFFDTNYFEPGGGAAVQYAAIANTSGTYHRPTSRNNFAGIATGAINNPSLPDRLKSLWKNKPTPPLSWAYNNVIVNLPSSPTSNVVSYTEEGYYKTEGSLSLPGGTATKKVTIYATGDITIRGNISTQSPPTPFSDKDTAVLLIISDNNIYIDSSVTDIQAILIAKNTIYTCTNGSGFFPRSQLDDNNCKNPLRIKGSVGAGSINFLRTTGSRFFGSPGETFGKPIVGTLGLGKAAEEIEFPTYLYFATPFLTDKTNYGFQSIFNAAPLL